MEHFNWTQLIPGVGHEYVHVATLVCVSIFIILLSLAARIALGSGEKSIEPAGRFSLKGMCELITEFIVDQVDAIIGKKGRPLVPLYGSIFIFIVMNNMAGLLPGMTPSTSNFNTTIALGIFSFCLYNYLGLKEGGVSYLKHFLGPIWWLAPLMVIIELLSHFFRPLTLGIRLGANMIGDHQVLSTFLDMTGYIPVSIIFYGFGLFVCLIQAYVFVLLSMIYVSMATEHEHEHH